MPNRYLRHRSTICCRLQGNKTPKIPGASNVLHGLGPLDLLKMTFLLSHNLITLGIKPFRCQVTFSKLRVRLIAVLLRESQPEQRPNKNIGSRLRLNRKQWQLWGVHSSFWIILFRFAAGSSKLFSWRESATQLLPILWDCGLNAGNQWCSAILKQKDMPRTLVFANENGESWPSKDQM